MDEDVRLHKLIAYYGYVSRRKAEKLIENGSVKVNGNIITELGTKVKRDSIIEINGEIINKNIQKVYLALNKPENFICSKSDELKRSTIYNLIDEKYKKFGIFNVGRLDYKTKGLIFLTNDGYFANIIAHPSFKITKEYEVTTYKDIPFDQIKKWTKGIIINGEKYRIKDLKKIGKNKISIILNEGKKREIRILFGCINLEIKELKRIRIGNVSIYGIEEGKYRNLTEEELKSFYKNRH